MFKGNCTALLRAVKPAHVQRCHCLETEVVDPEIVRKER